MDSGDFGFESGVESAAVVTARGTGSGLVIRLDGRVSQEELRTAVRDFLVSRKRFLSGNEVSLEWIGAKPIEEKPGEAFSDLFEDFNVRVRSSQLKEKGKVTKIGPLEETSAKNSKSSSSSKPSTGATSLEPVRSIEPKIIVEPKGGSTSLFDGVDALGFKDMGFKDIDDFEDSNVGASGEAGLWDTPDARVIYATLRSGQKIETEHSLIIFGDVNSGAELIAGGDIFVIGAMRGVAHAGAYEEMGGGRFIFALNLQPTQLRIGSVITRGTGEGSGKEEIRCPEIAYVDGNTIIVEPYQSRFTLQRGKFGLGVRR